MSLVLLVKVIPNLKNSIRFIGLIRKIKKTLGVKIPIHVIYSLKCKVNTDIYQYAGLKKLICISEFEMNLIHHLPNLYIKGEKGRQMLWSSDDRMNTAIRKLFQKHDVNE